MFHGHDIDLTSASQWRPFEHDHDGTVIITSKYRQKNKFSKKGNKADETAQRA